MSKLLIWRVAGPPAPTGITIDGADGVTASDSGTMTLVTPGSFVIDQSNLGVFPVGTSPSVFITTTGGVGIKRQVRYMGPYLPDNLDIDTSYSEFRGDVV